MKSPIRPVIRAAQTEPLHTFLSRRGFRFIAADATALQAAAATDPTIGTTPILQFADDLTLLNRGTFHLIRRGRPLCGCPHATGRALRVEGLDVVDWWRLCHRCWRRAEAAGLTSYGV